MPKNDVKYVHDKPQDVDMRLRWVVALTIAGITLTLLVTSRFVKHHCEATSALPSTAVVDTEPWMAPVEKSVSVSANVAFSVDRPAPPVDSVVITNGEEQLRILMARRKPIDTNVSSPVINR